METLSPPLNQTTLNAAVVSLVAQSDADSLEAAVASDGLPLAKSVIAAPSAKPTWEGWKVFGTTFITIFLAELGDKTQVSTLLMSAEFHAPWVVFAGAAGALITTSLLGVLLGQWLSGRLSARTLDIAAGITLALISLGLLWDVVSL